jgi:phosphatidylserine synthase
MAVMDKLYGLRHILHYTVPATVLVYYVVAVTVSILTLQNLRFPNRKTPRKVLPQLVAFVLLSYVVEAALFLTETFANGVLHSSTDSNVSLLPHIMVEFTRSSLPDWFHRSLLSRVC